MLAVPGTGDHVGVTAPTADWTSQPVGEVDGSVGTKDRARSSSPISGTAPWGLDNWRRVGVSRYGSIEFGLHPLTITRHGARSDRCRTPDVPQVKWLQPQIVCEA